MGGGGISGRGKAKQRNLLELERKGQQNYASQTETKADTGEFSGMAVALVATRGDSF